MLHLAFACTTCGSAPAAESFPLCPVCLDALVPAPLLCRNCGGPTCEPAGEKPTCKRPWILNPEIQSFTSLYLLVGDGYRVLRTWKYNRGPLLDRRLLTLNRAISERLHDIGAAAIVPVPQDFRRSWHLSGSPADHLASWLSRQLAVPKLPLLTREVPPGTETVRQTRLSLRERFENPLYLGSDTTFARSLGATSRKAILVDDFMTTGHTARIAASVLKSGGFDEIHVFCLGIRPGRTEQNGHLLKGSGRPEAIRENGSPFLLVS